MIFFCEQWSLSWWSLDLIFHPTVVLYSSMSWKWLQIDLKLSPVLRFHDKTCNKNLMAYHLWSRSFFLFFFLLTFTSMRKGTRSISWNVMYLYLQTSDIHIWAEASSSVKFFWHTMHERDGAWGQLVTYLSTVSTCMEAKQMRYNIYEIINRNKKKMY